MMQAFGGWTAEGSMADLPTPARIEGPVRRDLTWTQGSVPARVQVAWADETVGYITDIRCFELV